MYVTIEKLSHGMLRKRGKPATLWEAFNAYNEARGEWTQRGYTLLESVCGETAILDEESRAIGVIQVVRIVN